MINLETLKTDLKSWLEGLPSNQMVGIRNDPNRCVLSNFLTDSGGKAVTVRKGKARNVCLPEWSRAFYQMLDISCDRTTGNYTAATALGVLAKV